MSLNFKSLSGLDDIVTADGEHFVLVKTPEGFKDLKVTDLQVFINGTVIPRIENLEDNPLTSTWPVARKLSLAGPFTGEVFLDGRQDEVLTVTVPTGALPTSAVNGLPTLLLNLSNTADDHEARLGTAETTLLSKLDVTAAAASAAKWTNPRTITLTGLASGSVAIDGSMNVELNVTGLTVTKADVGLGNVDNTSDANKPISTATQTALNNKLNVGDAAVDYMGSTPAYYNATAAVDVNNFLGGSRALVARENANTPSAGQSFWYIETIKTYSSATNLMQRAYGYQSGELWTRYCYGGAWGAWRKVYDSSNFDPATKASLASSPVFDGDITTKGGNLYAQAVNNTSNANYWLRDETGKNQGVLSWDRTADVIRLRRYDVNGASVEGELAVGATSASYNGYNLWHSGNFDPSTKLDATATAAAATKLASARNFSLTGVVTATAVSFDGSGNVALATAIADNALLISKTSGLQAALDGKSATTHNHDTLYVKIPNSSPSVDPNTLGAVLSHTVIGSPTVNTPSAYMTVWNLGATGNRDGQFGWVFGSGSTDLYFRSRHDISGSWNAWSKIWHDNNFDPATKADAANPTLTGTITATNATLNLGGSASVAFGSTTRQMINLYGSSFGIGIQGSTFYCRTGSTGSGFAWYQAGVHSNTQWDPGAGGVEVMRLDNGGNLRTKGELQSTTSNGVRIVSGNYGTFWRNDGASLYLLITASGDQYGTWNALRPFTVALTTGDVTMSHNATVAGYISAARVCAGFDGGVANSVSCSAWFRSSGNSGWYNQSWGVGVYATDATYVRSYNAAGGFAAPDFVISSDRRLKDGIRDFEYRGRLRPVNYYHKETQKHEFGFIAQEVRELYPEVVGQFADTEMLQLSYPKLTAVLSAQLNRVEDENVTMRRELDELKEQMRILLAPKQPWWKRLFRR